MNEAKKKNNHLFDLNDFVLCPDGEFGKIKVFIRDDQAEIERKSGKKDFSVIDLMRLSEDDESLYYRDELNPKIFANNVMIPQVRNKLIQSSKDFLEEMTRGMTDQNIDLVVKDIMLVGSNASYNYSDFSDLDIHILYDTENLGDNLSKFFAKEYFEAFRRLFNQSHDIKIYDLPVEFYAEDINSNGVYNGRYSILNDAWIQFPDKNRVEINSTEVEAKYSLYKSDIDSCISATGGYETAIDLYKKLFKMRRTALQSGGEFCTENLAFKRLRNDGSITKLRDYIRNEHDKELSVESIRNIMHEAIMGNSSIDEIFKDNDD